MNRRNLSITEFVLGVIIVAAFFCVFAAVATHSQQPPTPQPAGPQPQVVTPKAPYDSTKAQLSVTKEENLQLKANAAQAAFQQQMKDLQDQWKAEESSLNVWIAAVKSANGWDDSYTYDRVKDQWVHTPKPPKPAEAPKKP